MWRGNGESEVCRPLNNPQKLQFEVYMDDNPKGSAPLNRSRFSHYQDVMGVVQQTSEPQWVERGKWGKVRISLMEDPNHWRNSG